MSAFFTVPASKLSLFRQLLEHLDELEGEGATREKD
jgi:hypothetical protein